MGIEFYCRLQQNLFATGAVRPDILLLLRTLQLVGTENHNLCE
jgi:hypothetical protein